MSETQNSKSKLLSEVPPAQSVERQQANDVYHRPYVFDGIFPTRLWRNIIRPTQAPNFISPSQFVTVRAC